MTITPLGNLLVGEYHEFFDEHMGRHTTTSTYRLWDDNSCFFFWEVKNRLYTFKEDLSLLLSPLLQYLIEIIGERYSFGEGAWCLIFSVITLLYLLIHSTMSTVDHSFDKLSLLYYTMLINCHKT